MKHATHAAVLFAVVLGLGACSSKSDDAAGGAADAGPSCNDGQRNGDEVGVDCGGSCPLKCDGAKGCTVGTDCASGVCNPDTTCGPSPGKTCGIGLPNPCNAGDKCSQDGDCDSDFCGDDQKCAAPPGDAHADGRRDAGETGIDCGGSVAATQPCPTGQGCATNDDCVGSCDPASLTCQDPSPTDGKKDGDETDVDCGGAAAPGCTLGKVCASNGDCQLQACTTTTCVTPTSTDGLQNGSETDVDCGGPGVTEGDVSYKAPVCPFDKKCSANADCATSACSMGTGKCTLASCATGETAGIVTCGAGETGAAGATHESCCRSLTLPTRTTRRLDKYEITAGRFRTFLTKVGPNVRQWVANYNTANPSSQLATLVGINPVVGNLYPAADRFDALSLTAHMSHDIDNYNGIRGCYNGYSLNGTTPVEGSGDYSANTYWMDDTHYADFGLPPRVTPRTTSDEKSLNCAMPIMFAAFCAWDGGELATFADYWDAWGNTSGYASNPVTDGTYPWATSNVCASTGGQGPAGSKPCANYNWCNGTLNNGGFTCQNTSLTTDGQSGVFYEFPLGTDRSLDNEPLIGAPGRFTLDASTLKSNGESWYDLWANMAETTGDFAASTTDFCDMSVAPAPGAQTCTRSVGGTTYGPGTHYTNIPVTGLIGDTWEGHQYGRGEQKVWPSTAQYGKFGARCVRPAAPF